MEVRWRFWERTNAHKQWPSQKRPSSFFLRYAGRYSVRSLDHQRVAQARIQVGRAPVPDELVRRRTQHLFLVQACNTCKKLLRDEGAARELRKQAFGRQGAGVWRKAGQRPEHCAYLAVVCLKGGKDANATKEKGARGQQKVTGCRACCYAQARQVQSGPHKALPCRHTRC